MAIFTYEKTINLQEQKSAKEEHQSEKTAWSSKMTKSKRISYHNSTVLKLKRSSKIVYYPQHYKQQEHQ